ncbi:MAG: transposase [Verrucomicrobia bacterium]|nr:transposase [Verrucomicrobiota bacterium]MCH8525627.1 transposase [Kiritimatiellia bacterium]
MKTSSSKSHTHIDEESRVPEYDLPSLLPEGGQADWPARRRTLMDFFSDHAYGRTPDAAPEGGVRVVDTVRGAAPQVEGAVRIQFTLEIGPVSNRHAVRVLLYLPAEKPRCCFLGVNFAGNHTIDADPEIELPRGWMYPWEGTGVVAHRATASGRGTRSRRWPVARILEKGFALGTFYCGDLAPDQAGHPKIADFKRLFPAPPDPGSEWGNIGIWAWGLCRVREVLAALPELEGVPCVAVGHSRMGKTALWAAAQDEAFAGALSNCSGCMGAALSRRCFGETVEKITQGFPHWFCPRLRAWAGREAEMPMDQHMLLALIAPRPLLVCSAVEDLWADPRGEFLATRAASPAYAMHGHASFADSEFPEPGQAVIRDLIAYYLRSGKHDMPLPVWEQGLTFFTNDVRYIRYFHPEKPKEIHENRLPHWQMEGAMYFVTWHLGDSLPVAVLKKWRLEREDWQMTHPRPWTPETEAEFHRNFSRRYEEALDKGCGSCLLRNPIYSEIMAECFRHFDQARYHLDCFVIMPNHVHVLFTLAGSWKLQDILQQWKSVSSHKIQKQRNTSGKLWQKDSWDRMIRNPLHYKRCRNYIRENPSKARLTEGHFVLYDSKGAF